MPTWQLDKLIKGVFPSGAGQAESVGTGWHWAFFREKNPDCPTLVEMSKATKQQKLRPPSANVFFVYVTLPQRA
jgi:hypothetical protein